MIGAPSSRITHAGGRELRRKATIDDAANRLNRHQEEGSSSPSPLHHRSSAVRHIMPHKQRVLCIFLLALSAGLTASPHAGGRQPGPAGPRPASAPSPTSLTSMSPPCLADSEGVDERGASIHGAPTVLPTAQAQLRSSACRRWSAPLCSLLTSPPRARAASCAASRPAPSRF